MERERKRRGGLGGAVFGWLLLALSAGLLLQSAALCFSEDIWYDELFTVRLAEHSYREALRFTAADVHPPLYYCIVKFFSDLCKLISPGIGTVVPAKLVSVLPFVLLLLYAVTFVRRRFGVFSAGLFSFCALAMPQLSAYTVEARMYGWALFFVTAALLHGSVLAQMSGEGQRRRCSFHAAALVAYGLAAAYTQYFAAVAVAALYLALLVWFLAGERGAFFRGRAERRGGLSGSPSLCASFLRRWFLWVGLSVLGYAPWLFALAGQLSAVGENYWILPLTWRSLGGCVKFVMKPAFSNEILNVILALALTAGCGAAVFAALRRGCPGSRGVQTEASEEEGGMEAVTRRKSPREQREQEEAAQIICGVEDEKLYHYGRVFVIVAGIVVLAGLVLFGFAASILFRPIFVYRYMIPALGGFWLSVALSVDIVLCKQTTIAKFSDLFINFSSNFELCKSKELRLCKLKAQNYELCQPKESRKRNAARAASFWQQGGEKRRAASGVGVAHILGLALTVLLVFVGLRNYRAFWGEEAYRIRLMGETEQALAQIGSADAALFNFDQLQAVAGYYLPESTARFLWCAQGETLIQELTSPCGLLEETGEMQALLADMEVEGAGGSLWFLGSFHAREEIVAGWRRSGLTVEEKGSFLLERYWFNLYKISDFAHTD